MRWGILGERALTRGGQRRACAGGGTGRATRGVDDAPRAARGRRSRASPAARRRRRLGDATRSPRPPRAWCRAPRRPAAHSRSRRRRHGRAASPTSARPRPRARGRIPAGRPARVRRWSSFARNDERAVGCARRSRTSEARARSRASPGRERKSCRPAVREASRSGPPRAGPNRFAGAASNGKKKESGVFKPSTEGSRPKNHNLPCCQVSAPRTTPLRSATRFFPTQLPFESVRHCETIDARRRRARATLPSALRGVTSRAGGDRR